MNILYLRNSRNYHMDVIEVLRKRGHNLIINTIPDYENELSARIVNDKEFYLYESLEKNNWDIIFSLDYYPTISIICNKLNKPYISWNTEPPFSNLYSSTVIYLTNLIFVADKWVAEKFKQEGVNNIFYLPEGINLQRSNEHRIAAEGNKDIDCSMIGSCKIPTWQELFKTNHLLDATIGYLDGLVTSQSLIFGYDFFEKSLPEYLYKDLVENSRLYLSSDSVQSIQHFYAEHCFYPRITAIDRRIATKLVAEITNIYLYTDDEKLKGNNLVNCGMISYEKELSIIEKSKININIAPRGFKNGIYGHALKIMGMSGFLITDYRNELVEEFVPGKDFIIYEDAKDLMEKVKYYLERPDDRSKIGKNVYEKVITKHTLDKRIEVIEELSGNILK